MSLPTTHSDLRRHAYCDTQRCCRQHKQATYYSHPTNTAPLAGCNSPQGNAKEALRFWEVGRVQVISLTSGNPQYDNTHSGNDDDDDDDDNDRDVNKGGDLNGS